MHNPDLSPITVARFNKDTIIEHIRYKTGWDHRGEVSDKIQLNYLCNYLNVDHINAQTVVIEDEYIDRHYLEDYAEYYARCFSYHPRKCSRMHFFNIVFDGPSFIDALKQGDKDFLGSLADAYIGHAVIRPIPHTFLAKVCIKPYEVLASHSAYKIIKKTNSVSLFGVPLTVNTTAFLEQDKVVATCATSALWTLLNASPEAYSAQLPSPSAITKSASHPTYDGSRTFPATGLSAPQVARSLKHFGLEPTVELLDESPDPLSTLKEHVLAHVSNDIPMLLGGTVYQVTSTSDKPDTYDTLKWLGRHFVCVLGYHVKDVDYNGLNASGLNLLSHHIDKIYVHDDRLGPFVRLATDQHEFTKVLNDRRPLRERGTKVQGLELALYGERRDIFVPDILITGVYHKIRIQYTYVHTICNALHYYLGRLRLDI